MERFRTLANPSRFRTTGFTLTELLVIFAILVLLLLLLLPAAQSAREAARRFGCANRFHQIGVALLSYEADHRHLPRAYTPAWRGRPGVGSCSQPTTHEPAPDEGLQRHYVLSFLLPYLEQQTLYDQIDFARNWSVQPNWKRTLVDLPMYLCPSAPPRPGEGAADYGACVDLADDAFCNLEQSGLATPRQLETLLGMLHDQPTRLPQVTDGLSYTFLFFEDAGRPYHFIHDVQQKKNVYNGWRWADDAAYFIWGNSPDCGLTSFMNCSNWDEIYSFHPDGANFLYGDGAVHFLSEELEIDLFLTLFTRAAGDGTPADLSW